MTFKIPQPIKDFSFGNPIPVFNSLAYRDPKEGKCYMPVNIAWDGNGTTEHINLRGTASQPFSQIVMMAVDNSESGADISFYFPDTTFTLDVPAGSAGLFPVFTGQLDFYASSPAAISTDQTFIQVLNYRQEPVTNPAPESHSATGSGQFSLTTHSVQLLATSGTVTGYDVTVSATSAAGGQVVIELHDSQGATIAEGGVTLLAGQSFNGPLLSLTGINYRVPQGVALIVTLVSGAFDAGSFVSATVFFRKP